MNGLEMGGHRDGLATFATDYVRIGSGSANAVEGGYRIVS